MCAHAAAYRVLLATVCLTLIVGCRNSPASARADGTPPPSPSPTHALSPAQVTKRLQIHHQQREYDKIAPLIVEECRDQTIALLRAIDAVIDAIATLEDTAQKTYVGPATETWRLSAMENNLGPFSAQVSLINERFKGDTATVTLQEGSNIPLVHAQFKRVDGQWQYQPDAIPIMMVAELDRLAFVIRDVEQSVRQGAPIESYLDAFMYRIIPQMAKVVTAVDEPPMTVAAGDKAD